MCTRRRGFFSWPFFLVFALSAGSALPPVAAQSSASTRLKTSSQSALTIPPGTMLPARLNQSVSSRNAKPGQTLTARIMQAVPLPNGQKIPAGAKLAGKIVSVQSAANATKASIEFGFDALLIGNQSIPIVTNLRAIAGFMEVLEARTPQYTPGFGAPYYWVPTRQIGGDQVYGVGGPVTDPNGDRVGSGVYGGVLVHIRAHPDSKCPGPLEPDDRLQALWVFSADACGVYGLDHLEIAHAGRTDPVGTILLTAEAQQIKLRSGDALLLRIR